MNSPRTPPLAEPGPDLANGKTAIGGDPAPGAPHATSPGSRFLVGGGPLFSMIVVSTTRGLAVVLTLIGGILSARYFGASLEKDCYVVADAVPRLLSTILLGGVFSLLLVSLSEIGARRGAAGQIAFTWKTVRQLSLILIPVLIAVTLFPRFIIRLIAPGFAAAQINLSANLLILAMLTMVAGLFFAVLRALFQARLLFTPPGLANLLVGLATIPLLVLLVRRLGIYALALGPLVGSFLALLVLWAFVGACIRDRPGFVPAEREGNPSHSQQGRFWTQFFWMSLGANFGQVNLLIDNIFGSFLPTGSIALLGFAFVILTNAELLTTYSLAEVALPDFSVAAQRGNPALESRLHSHVRYMLLLTAPLTAGCLVFGGPVARLLFERGEFGSEATLAVGQILSCFAPEVLFMGYLALYWRVLVARRRLRAVGIASALAIALNALLDYLLMGPLGVRGIALATTAVTLALAIVLGFITRREGLRVRQRGDYGFTTRVLSSAAIMGMFLLAWTVGFEHLQDVSGLAARLVEVLLGAGLGMALYLGILLLAGIEETRALLRALREGLPSLRA